MMKKICIGIVCVAAVIQVLLLVGTMIPEYTSDKPDDAISQAIHDVVGDDVYYYADWDDRGIEYFYCYVIKEGHQEKTVVHDIFVVANKIIKEQEITGRVCIMLYHPIPGGMTYCVSMHNYSNDELLYADYKGLQRLVIGGNDMDSDCIYNEPSVYTTLTDIKYLEIDAEIQEKAKQENIDWYIIWPELENVELFAYDVYWDGKMPDDAISKAICETVNYDVFYLGKSDGPDDIGLCYKYHIRDKNMDVNGISKIIGATIRTVNDTIKKENITDYVSINFYWCNEFGTEEVVLSLHNYSDSQFEYPDLEGLGRVVILGGYYEEFKYNNPEIYSLLPNIKYLEVKEHIQEKADLQGIDWYDYWPDLESIKLITSDIYPDGKMPDDAISSAIWNAVENDLQYCGKSNKYRPMPELVYEYYIRTEGKDNYKITNVLYDAISAVNRTIKEENITDLVSIYFYIGKREYHNTELVLHLYNYSEYQLENPDLEGLQKAVIVGAEYKNSEYNNPEIYSLLPNIKYLEVKERVQGKAYEQDIDWYDYWSDLESIEVF